MLSWAISVVIGCLVSAEAGTATGPASAGAPAVERPLRTPPERLAEANRRIDAFLRHIETREDTPPPVRQTLVEAWSRHRPDGQPADFLMAGLAILSEPFRQALTALEEERYPDAQDLLEDLSNSENPWLAVNAAALLARAMVEQDRTDEAEPLLADLAGREAELAEYSFLEAEVDFLLGYCRLANLDYDRARAALEQFEREHPEAPDKYRLPARQMLQELAIRQPGGLGEVSDLMNFAGRRLAHGRADESVQTRQQRAVELLEKLIEEAEEREKQQAQGGGAGGGARRAGGPGGPGGAPAPISALPGGRGTKGPLHRSPPARPGEQWGQMRPEERERIMQALREHFPGRYRQLVEQYYRQLAKEP